MHIKRKSSDVDLDGVEEGLVRRIVRAAHPSYKRRDNLDHLVVTSAAEGHPGDGVHHRGSLHYPANTPPDAGGRALDLRVWGFTADERAQVAAEIAHRLGESFDVVDEHDHIHIEKDPS
jgi:hypothetical protein